MMMEISRARIGNGRLIEPSDIQLIMGYDKETSIKDRQNVIKTLQTGSEDLLVSQYCNYYGLDYHEIISFLSRSGNNYFDWMDDLYKKLN